MQRQWLPVNECNENCAEGLHSLFVTSRLVVCSAWCEDVRRFSSARSRQSLGLRPLEREWTEAGRPRFCGSRIPDCRRPQLLPAHELSVHDRGYDPDKVNPLRPARATVYEDGEKRRDPAFSS